MFEEERSMMVRYQLMDRDIVDRRVLKAMEKVPRHLFMDESLWDRAYSDMALPIGEGQTISQPFMVAIMTELLELKGDEKVLEIGTGSGYQAAVLAELCREVYTIERIERLAQRTKRVFDELGYTNITLRVGDGTVGWPEEAPFDGIIVTAAAPEIPEVYIEQLSDGGRLVIPVGERYSQMLYKVERTKAGPLIYTSTPCVFVPLIGEHGWREDQ